MLINEELHLLLHRPDGRPEQAWVHRASGAVAALVVDLTIARRVHVTPQRRPRLHLVSATLTGDPVLDAAIRRLPYYSGRPLDRILTAPRLDPYEHTVTALVADGVLTLGEPRAGGGFVRAAERDPEPELAIRARLARVIDGVAEPTAADVTLLAILQALGVAPRLLRAERGVLTGRELAARIADLTYTAPLGRPLEGTLPALVGALLSVTGDPIRSMVTQG